MSEKTFGCGRNECHCSTTIGEDVSFGTGKLDDYGFWEVPCAKCAREWEVLHPEERAWPFAKVEGER